MRDAWGAWRKLPSGIAIKHRWKSFWRKIPLATSYLWRYERCLNSILISGISRYICLCKTSGSKTENPMPKRSCKIWSKAKSCNFFSAWHFRFWVHLFGTSKYIGKSMKLGWSTLELFRSRFTKAPWLSLSSCRYSGAASDEIKMKAFHTLVQTVAIPVRVPIMGTRWRWQGGAQGSSRLLHSYAAIREEHSLHRTSLLGVHVHVWGQPLLQFSRLLLNTGCKCLAFPFETRRIVLNHWYQWCGGCLCKYLSPLQWLRVSESKDSSTRDVRQVSHSAAKDACKGRLGTLG